MSFDDNGPSSKEIDVPKIVDTSMILAADSRPSVALCRVIMCHACPCLLSVVLCVWWCVLMLCCALLC